VFLYLPRNTAKMQTLSIDIETYSETSLKDAGTYRYAEDPAFTILLFACSIDGGPVVVYDLTIENLPDEIVKAITDPAVKKTAYNASFERICISAYLKTYLPPEQWFCTMVHGAYAGLPFGLDLVAKVLNLPIGKLAEGKALIKYFCTPCKPTKVNGGRTRNMPWHNPEKWQRFIEYNAQDVTLEMLVYDKIKFVEITDTERGYWALDQRINDRGVLLDTKLISRAILMDDYNAIDLMEEARKLTGLENPNSAAQLKQFLGVTSLTKANVKELADTAIGVDKRVLQIRQELAKTSNKKWAAMLDCISADGRARGLIQFYGAGRTGRNAGRRIQPQNLPGIQLNDKDLDTARNMVLAGDTDGLDLLYGNLPDTLSQLIRTAFIAEPGKLLYVSDLSSIEARITAWLAGENWRLEIFKTHGKIYEASAAAMLRKPIDQVTKPERQRGKIAELALGYQGGVNALITMGALNMGLTEDELPDLVYSWRGANKKIVAYWKIINDAAIDAVRDNAKITTQKNVVFQVIKNVLFITLPSGRKLAYLRPKIEQGQYGEVVTYEGVIQLTKQWGRIQSYGGKWVENIVQAIARDVLMEGMLKVDAAGYPILLNVHDELIAESGPYPDPASHLDFIVSLMAAPIKWAPGLPLGADGFVSKYYKK